jgi:hypothetical protein
MTEVAASKDHTMCVCHVRSQPLLALELPDTLVQLDNLLDDMQGLGKPAERWTEVRFCKRLGKSNEWQPSL